jgi:hypothetical protein
MKLLTPRAGHRQPFSITCTRVNLMGSSKNVNDTAPKNYASNYDIDEERNIIDNDDNDHERNWMSLETSSMLLIFFI